MDPSFLAYWNLFLRTGDDLKWYYLADPNQDKYVGTDSVLFTHGLETERGWGNENQRSTEEVFVGTYASVMRSDQLYGLTFARQVSELTTSPNLVRVGAMVNANSRTTDLYLMEEKSGLRFQPFLNVGFRKTLQTEWLFTQ